MSKNKDPNYIAKVEKAITEKYGEETIQNPKANWCPEKEKEYLKQLEKKERKIENTEKNKRKIENKIFRFCKVCDESKTKYKDDIYFLKFKCCQKCYIEYVENREERWLDGWRPGEK